MYQLFTKSNNLIFTASANNLEHAIQLFSGLKCLSKEVLLTLFIVREKK